MDKQTLSNYGWIVICILVLCVMIALATPFGSFIASSVKSTTQGLFDVSQKALNNVGFGQIPDQSFEDSYNGNGVGGEENYNHDAPELHHSNLIPEGATYTLASTDEILVEGDEFPETLEHGDVYTFGQYKYTYVSRENGWTVAINTNVVDKNQTTYSPILESINAYPIVNLGYTFSDCTQLTKAPVIPENVVFLSYAFLRCTSLTKAPAIPNGVIHMNQTFKGCTSLTVAPVIPEGARDIASLFAGCTALKVAPSIPNSAQNMYQTFYDCTSLTGTIEINANPSTSSLCFANTQLAITITGSCSDATKTALAGTAQNGNVSY